MVRTRSYFRREKLALRIGGISLRDTESTRYKILSKIACLFFLLYPFLAASDIFKNDLETLLDFLTYEITIFVGVIKAITALLHRKKMAKLLNRLDTDPILTKYVKRDDGQENLMKRCLVITNIQTSVYWVAAGVTYIFTLAYSLAKRIRSSDYHDWQFPYGTFAIVNVTYSPNFEISWLYQCLSCAYIGLHFSTTDVLIAAVLCHVCFHLKILQNSLRKIVEDIHFEKKNANISRMSTLIEAPNKNNTGSETIKQRKLHASLKDILRYHLAIIDIMNEINELFGGLLLLVFIATLGILSLMVYKASLIPVNDVRMLRSCGELAVGVVQVLMICFWSEQMIFEGGEVGTAAYGSNFVGTDLKFQRSLILIIRRSQSHIRLTAGFVRVSLAVFAWILRSTYSYYMVLRKHNLKEN